MNKISKAIMFAGFGLSIGVSGISLAEKPSSDMSKAEYREMKKAHRAEHRDMHRHHRGKSMLKLVDTNEDGKVDLNEYLTHAEARFNKLDLDANGYVTTDEAKDAMKKMRKEHKKMRKEMHDNHKKNKEKAE